MIKSRLSDGLNYYKNGSLTLEQTLDGFEEVLKDYSPVEPPVKPANGNKDKVVSLINKMIIENKKHFDKGICWLCYEDDYCYHKYKIEALEELKSRLSV